MVSTLAGRRLYLCSPDRPDLASFLGACIAGGVDVVQLREKHLDDSSLVRRAELAREVCHKGGVPFILNDRPDLALICEADGVHVGQEDLPPSIARRVLGKDAIIGLSTHSPEELAASEGEPVDYVSAGPVAETPTKPGRAGTGLEYVRHATEHAHHPYFVTGGVTPESVPAMAEAGATHFVVVRYLCDSDDPESAARKLRHAIDRAVESD